MAHPLKLLLPALMPSWNFFDVIANSPRVEYARTAAADDASGVWLEFRPRPQRVAAVEMLRRLVWNPRWNEALFVVSCAERLLAEPTPHSQDEIFRRIAADLDDLQTEGASWLRFRIVLVSPSDGGREIAFVSEARRLSDIAVR